MANKLELTWYGKENEINIGFNTLMQRFVENWFQTITIFCAKYAFITEEKELINNKIKPME